MLALAAPGDAAYAFAVSVARDGPRPAGSAAEARAHRRVAQRFRAAGLTVRVQRFSTPRGRSRNVIGVREGRGDCLRVLMAHTDSMPAGPGAEDNASGLGVLVGAGAAAARRRSATSGSSPRAPRSGSTRARRTTSARGRWRRTVPRRRLRYALSLDEVGTSARLRLRSPVAAPRARRGARAAARGRARPAPGWTGSATPAPATPTTASSSWRAARAVKLGVVDNPCRHEPCDTPDRLRKGAFRAVLRLVGARSLERHERAVLGDGHAPLRGRSSWRRWCRSARVSRQWLIASRCTATSARRGAWRGDARRRRRRSS